MDLRRAERPLRGDRARSLSCRRHLSALRCPQTFQKDDSHLVAAQDFGRL
jgi:hypothetical protein